MKILIVEDEPKAGPRRDRGAPRMEDRPPPAVLPVGERDALDRDMLRPHAERDETRGQAAQYWKPLQ